MITKNDSGTGGETVDTLLSALTEQFRRDLVYYLDRRPTTTFATESLARDLAEEFDRTSEDLLVSLHHRHLPALETADVLEYDPDRGRVRYGPDPEVRRLLAVLEVVPED